MRRQQIKRETDFQIISTWVQPDSSVLDIGCGRGILLHHLQQNHRARVLGVDTNLSKVQSCVKRSVPIYHGVAEDLLPQFPDHAFDWVILSRTLPELPRPGELITESLRVGRNLVVGFTNYGFWLNRLHALARGTRPLNEVFPHPWHQSAPDNPVTINGFRRYADEAGLHLEKAVYLCGDWRRPVRWLPNLTAGYALFHLHR